MNQPKQLTTIGRAEVIELLDHDKLSVVAKVDTGADISSIGASDITETADGLSFVLFYPGHTGYSGEVITIPKADYKMTRIANSFGQREMRYVVKLRVKVKGRIIAATFSLADRSNKLYPVLLGRKLLKNKFVVDVTQGDPLHQQEKARKHNLLQEFSAPSDTMENPL